MGRQSVAAARISHPFYDFAVNTDLISLVVTTSNRGFSPEIFVVNGETGVIEVAEVRDRRNFICPPAVTSAVDIYQL
jgi:hypothetical protein